MSKSALVLAGLSAAWLLGAGAANANTTLTFEGYSCPGCTLVGSLSKGGNLGPLEVFGNFVSTGQLVFADDWVSFELEPDNTTGTISVELTTGPVFPNEQWQLVSGSAGGTIVVNPTNVTGSEVTESLTAGVTYYLELASSGPAICTDAGCNATSEAEVTVTPLPAAFPLFASGLGLMGFWSRRRKRKAA